jgi:putative SOS response-associated peptidase YedK
VVDRYNIRISETAPVFTQQGGETSLLPMKFGLVPPFMRDRPKRKLLHNARSETVTELKSFCVAVRFRRCLIPACGFYESMTRGKISWPFVFTLKEEEPFAIAGIWEPGIDDSPPSFSMVTTHPNEFVAKLHDRMPVVLTPADMPRWLGDEPLPDATLQKLCQPISEERMVAREVNRYANKTRSEGPGCLAPPDEPDPELKLGV